nr:LysE family transporter [Aeromicrobium sp. 9AM]
MKPVWTFAAALGAMGLIAASEPAFITIEVVGAAYLICLGYQSLFVAIHFHTTLRHDGPVATLPGRRAIRQGLINGLANPKMAASLHGLLPQFVSAGNAAFLINMLTSYGSRFTASL